MTDETKPDGYGFTKRKERVVEPEAKKKSDR
jgi:hypothetical protein